MSDNETRVRARLREYADAVVPISDVPAVGRARYRRRVRRQRAAAVLAGVLVVVGASGVGVELARRPSHQVQVGTRGGSSSAPSSSTPTTDFTPATAQPGAAITGQPVVDTSWISDDVGWMLFPDGVLHTTDGGTTWRYLSPTPFGVDQAGDPCGIDCVSRIRFADANHGWIFGTGFAVTSDGGHTWTQSTAPPVVALEVAHGRAYRLISEGGGCPGPCDYALQTTTVGSDEWNGVRTPDIGPATEAQLLYDGPRLYIATYGSAMNPYLHLVRSVDAGASWQRRANPCALGAADLPVQLATAPDGFVVALCRHNAGGTYVRTSSDAATTFGPARSLPKAFSAPGVGGVAVAAGSPSSIAVVGFVSSASWALDVSHDGGSSWSETQSGSLPQGDDSVSFLGFEDAQTGRFAVTGDRLWTTRDGGDTWTLGRP